MRHAIVFLSLALFLSCSAGEKKQDEHIYWVNSTKVSCVGMAPSKCLQVQKNETLDPSAWITFHASIEGFDYKQGYIYKLLLKEKHLDPDDLPADASTISYTLLEIIEKRQDLKFRINGRWMVIELSGTTPPSKSGSEAIPKLEIDIEEMLYFGNDGCNNFNGGIMELDENTIRFGIAASTRMMCMDMELPDLFNASLPQVHRWDIKENLLHLYDEHGKLLLKFQKSD